MSVFDIEETLAQARRRLPPTASTRRRRSDAGKLRLARPVMAVLRPLLLGHERPNLAAVRRTVAASCRRLGCRVPARATLYRAIASVDGHRYAIASLPAAVRVALYNLDETGVVPGHQLAFYCFNYGDLAAMSFAAGLPWLDLHQAARLRGWRPRSRGLLDAALAVRGIA
jgi:hypothetical protein